MVTAKKTPASAPKTAAKAAPKAAPKAAAKSAATAAAKPAASAAEPKVRAASLKIRDLVAKVSEATGGKKKGIKETVEATLLVLGDALSRGEDLNLPGLGRARVARSAEKDGASMLTLKVKRGPHRRKEAKEALAEDGEDS